MIVQGTLDMLILKTLALEPLHGYGIALRIEQVSQGVFSVNAGSLFPAFRRLEREGLSPASVARYVQQASPRPCFSDRHQRLGGAAAMS